MYDFKLDNNLYNFFHLLKPGKDSKYDIDIEQKDDVDDKNEKNNILYCIKCRYQITSNSERIIINDKHEHVFTNPNGYIFRIGCFSKAPGCIMTGEASSYFSWFQGYTWQIAVCRQCLTLMGWCFNSSKSQFLGLILDKLIALDISDN